VSALAGPEVMQVVVSRRSTTSGWRNRRGRKQCGVAVALDQILVLTVVLRSLSTPVEETEVTAKYHVPEDKFVKV
jgi:hypothetical protein